MAKKSSARARSAGAYSAPAAPAIIGRARAPVAPGNVQALNDLRREGNYAGEPDIAIASRVGVDHQSMEKFSDKDVDAKIKVLFPDVDPGEEAVDCFVIIQELMVPTKVGSIIKPYEQTEHDQTITSFGKVRSIGPMSFHQDVTGEEVPGGRTFAVGDIVRMPKFGGQEFVVDGVIFDIWKDRDVKSRITNMRKLVAQYF